MERVAFGSEKNFYVIGETCPGCNVKAGHNHTPGCPVERCPKCGGKLLQCTCLALSFADEWLIAEAIGKNLTRENVHQIIDSGSKSLDKTYTEIGAFRFIMSNLPPELEKEAQEMAGEILGSRKIEGGFLVSDEKLSELMGCTVEEARENMQELNIKQSFPDWEKHTGREQ